MAPTQRSFPSAARPAAARALAATAVVLGALVPTTASRADDPAAAAALLAQRAPAVVTVRFVQRMRHPQMGEREMHADARGVVVDASGLVLLSNDALEPGAGLLRGLARRDAAADVKATPGDFKVLLRSDAKADTGEDAKEHAAVLVTRDAALSLAWVALLDPPAALARVELAAGGAAPPRVGTTVYGVSRKSRGFDVAPFLERAFVAGHVETPRPMWSLSSLGGVTVGLPFYDAAGHPVGVAVQMAGVEGAEAGGLLARPDVGLFLLPVDVVGKALEAVKKLVPGALERAQSGKAEAATEKAPTTTPTPSPTPKPDGPAAPAPDAPK